MVSLPSWVRRKHQKGRQWSIGRSTETVNPNGWPARQNCEWHWQKRIFMTQKRCACYQIGFPFLHTINDSDYGLSKRRQECHHTDSHKWWAIVTIQGEEYFLWWHYMPALPKLSCHLSRSNKGNGPKSSAFWECIIMWNTSHKVLDIILHKV